MATTSDYSKSPLPKNGAVDISSPFPLSISEMTYLPFPGPLPQITIQDVLQKRESVLGSKPLIDITLSSLLYYSVSTMQTKVESNKLIWRKKNVASAGGVHANKIFVVRHCEDASLIWFYDDIAHALCSFKVSSEPYFIDLINEVRAVIGMDSFTSIITVCDIDLINKKYLNAQSLVYRDVGSIFSTIELIATALELNCCQLGITCEPYMSNLLANDNYVGTGACVISTKE